MRKYEGLFILNIAGHEDGLNEISDRVTGEITKLGAKIETIQKMDKKHFARVADKAQGSHRADSSKSNVRVFRPNIQFQVSGVWGTAAPRDGPLPRRAASGSSARRPTSSESMP